MDIVVGRVGEIHRYPVKSMAGESLRSTHLDAGGIPADRAFALRNVDNGKLLSAKLPRIARVLLGCTAGYDADGTCWVQLPAGGGRFVCDDSQLLAALGDLLGCQVALERGGGSTAGVYESDWPAIDGMTLAGTHDFPVAMLTAAPTFADLAGLHLVSTASLTTLAGLAPGSQITQARFRPGLVVESLTAPGGFEENLWAGRTMRIGQATISVTMATMRCVMTTVEQGDLPHDPAVLQTLAAHNRLHFDGAGDFACLGAYAEVTGAGDIAVGDDVVLCG
jgi:hypothetical protein